MPVWYRLGSLAQLNFDLSEISSQVFIAFHKLFTVQYENDRPFTSQSSIALNGWWQSL
jgi:hypothetical protein